MEPVGRSLLNGKFFCKIFFSDCENSRIFAVELLTLKIENNMEKYVCNVCGYVYDPAVGDPDNGIAPGTKFEDLPADWVCPLCSVDKTHFEKQ